MRHPVQHKVKTTLSLSYPINLKLSTILHISIAEHIFV